MARISCGSPVALMTQFLATSQATAQSAIPPDALVFHGGELSVAGLRRTARTRCDRRLFQAMCCTRVVEVDTKAGTLRPALYPEHLGLVVAFNYRPTGFGPKCSQ